MDLFDYNQQSSAEEYMPLAERMRPRNLDEYIGQTHLVGKGKTLRHLIEADKVPSMILQGPPSSGKTTLATIISHLSDAEFIKLNAVSLSIALLRDTFEKAKDMKKLYNKRTLVFIDEIHAMKSNIQESLLPVVENGTITLIGCTTESIQHDIIPPLVSRCRVFQLQPLTDQEIRSALLQALSDTERGLGKLKVTIAPDALAYLADICNGDLRNALNALEAAVFSTFDSDVVELPAVQEAYATRINTISTNDMYNLTSALCKSMRGGHTDGALYWLARLLDSGVDPMYIVRRVIVHSCEDVGMANPNALQVAVAAKEAIQFVGMPEGRLPLAQAVVYVCESPKSNSVYKGINAALQTVRDHRAYEVPAQIRDGTKTYVNPIDNPGAVIQYLPNELKHTRFYIPQNAGVEGKIFTKYHDKRSK
ncbi:replication-associated recombination protein A [Paenibacillus puerhi]|uniref:replication-associated recombination protein A n=1 Tax=Paenibacillus puerhi TaxID=2692622 RepID=UPI001356959C|nr:replication-associated recombination protein A [Paenibacillus puerhi]